MWWVLSFGKHLYTHLKCTHCIYEVVGIIRIIKITYTWNFTCQAYCCLLGCIHSASFTSYSTNFKPLCRRFLMHYIADCMFKVSNDTSWIVTQPVLNLNLTAERLVQFSCINLLHTVRFFWPSQTKDPVTMSLVVIQRGGDTSQRGLQMAVVLVLQPQTAWD